MVQDTPSRKLDQYIVRFPDGMRDRLKEAAAANKRSLNAEIVARLEQSFGAIGLGAANRPKRTVSYEELRRDVQDLIKELRALDSLAKKKV